MLDNFDKFNRLLQDDAISFVNEKFMKILKLFSFHHISENFDLDKHQEIKTNIKDSEVIMINSCVSDDHKDTFLFIGFKKTLLAIDISFSLSFLNILLTSSNSPIYILPNTKEIFNNCVNFKICNPIIEDDSKSFFDEITKFSDNINIKSKVEQPIIKIWKSIRQCITGYLIKQSYEKLNQIQNQFSSIENDVSEFKEWNSDEYIELGAHGYGSSFYIELIYHIERNGLFVIKKPSGIDEKDIHKLTNRIIQNNLNLNHPLLPKLYGYVKNADQKYPIIQYINGHTLEKIKELHLNENEKITIIFEIMIIIKYLHEHELIYRDLKPDNIIIDRNKNIFLIDFDRVIKKSDIFDIENLTIDLNSSFIAPEVNLGQPSYKSDIYSIGKMIYYIMNEKNPDNCIDAEAICENYTIRLIYEKCTYKDAKCRPFISDILFFFFLIFSNQISDKIKQFFINTENTRRSKSSKSTN